MISIIHSGGYYTTYFSLKKNSILVAEGDTVQAGDTIGYPGSSHQLSQTPHLLFEVGNLTNNTVQHKNPWDGECEPGRSMWVNQLPYIGDSTLNKGKLYNFYILLIQLTSTLLIGIPGIMLFGRISPV